MESAEMTVLNSDEFRFDDLTPRSKPATIGGKRYILREASEGAAAKYRDALQEGTRVSQEGEAFVGSNGGADTLLLSLCLFELYDLRGEEKERSVVLSEVHRWPARIVRPMVDWIKEVSGMTQTATAEGIQKEIAKLQLKLKRLEKDGSSKNGHSPTPQPSDTTPISA